jgi:hypothetical protein
VSKNLAKFHKDHLYDDDYEGFGMKFEKTKKKVGESVEIKKSKNTTTTRFKPKDTKSHLEEDYYY